MTNIIRKITAPQQKALTWLINHGGTGVFDSNGCTITASGATLTYKRDVWVGLRDALRIEFYNDGPNETPFGGVRVVK